MISKDISVTDCFYAGTAVTINSGVDKLAMFFQGPLPEYRSIRSNCNSDSLSGYVVYCDGVKQVIS